MKRYLHYENFGDFDARRTEMYWHHDALPLEVGSYPVRFRRGGASLTILSVSDTQVMLRFGMTEYTVVGGEMVAIEDRESQASEDGPWHVATDEVRFSVFETDDLAYIAPDKNALRELITLHSNLPHYTIKVLYYAIPADYEDLLVGMSYHMDVDRTLRVAQPFVE